MLLDYEHSGQRPLCSYPGGPKGGSAPLGVTRASAHGRRLLDVALERDGRRTIARAVPASGLLADELAAQTLGQHDAGRRTALLVSHRGALLGDARLRIVGILVTLAPRKERELTTTLDGQACSGKGGRHCSTQPTDFVFETPLGYPGGNRAFGMPVNR